MALSMVGQNVVRELVEPFTREGEVQMVSRLQFVDDFDHQLGREPKKG
jgi:hypothetical protein